MTQLSLQAIRDHTVPAGSLTIWWLGQTGFMIKSPDGVIAALDPYLSNSCKAIGDRAGIDFDRAVPPPMPASELAGMDLYAVTHSHQDHLDPETVGPCLAGGGPKQFLAPAAAAAKLRDLGVPEALLTTTWPNREIRIRDLTMRAAIAVLAGGTDHTHVGYLVRADDGPTFYFTGDTAYHDILALAVADHHPDVLVTVINGVYRNLGPDAAAKLASQIQPQLVIPCHYDLFPEALVPPRLLRLNLSMYGLQERYCELTHGVPFSYPQHG